MDERRQVIGWMEGKTGGTVSGRGVQINGRDGQMDRGMDT